VNKDGNRWELQLSDNTGKTEIHGQPGSAIFGIVTGSDFSISGKKLAQFFRESITYGNSIEYTV